MCYNYNYTMCYNYNSQYNYNVQYTYNIQLATIYNEIYYCIHYIDLILILLNVANNTIMMPEHCYK